MNKNKKHLLDISVGLQDVDYLKTSKYYDELSQKYINNEIQLEEFSQIIEKYYQDKKDANESNKEADLVANRINLLLSDDSFSLNIRYLQNIHKFLFRDILPNAGSFRQKNISKKEWILNGDNVIYGDYRQIKEIFEYDFSQEKEYQYTTDINESINHIACFISNIWQTHPFIEGNTRAIAVFLIKYLRYLGIKSDNDTFKNNSWYFRNALVRANYSNIKKGIKGSKSFLIKFLRNFILNEKNSLSNRQMHINALDNLKLIISTRQQAIIEMIGSNPHIIIETLAKDLNCSLITIKRDIAKLKKLRVLKRLNSKKKPTWVVVGFEK